MTRSVLIVDDEFGLADIAADLLRDVGYDVVIAINGKVGLASLSTRPVDLVIVDLMMPVMDGPEMIGHMRADPALAHIPVILMTALPEAIKSDTGADATLVKPFGFKQLLETIDRLLKRIPG
ncbi:MAG TPA: response regulator [Kofleriaceae bacterium]|nr:response regulator [Kofleriaceae bacterium]